ncbi:Ankyrin repeat-containing domain [Trinorchestia longiramus]|nr:Ankyrin repeat-containing domain [Trinorchestia longiramus]
MTLVFLPTAATYTTPYIRCAVRSQAPLHSRPRSYETPSADKIPEVIDHDLLDDTDSGHPFTRAALAGNAATVKDMCQRPTFDANSKRAQHALLAACRSGHVEVARVLLDAGVDVHCKDAKAGWQAIHYATYKDRVKVVELLLSYGEWGVRCVALVRACGVTCSVLHLAAHYGCCSVLSFLLTNMAKLNLAIDMRDAGHWTSLHHAVCESRMNAVELLLQAGADVNVADPHGVTALHVAAAKDNLGLFRLLMENKANPKMNVINAGTTPSHRPLRHSVDHIWSSRAAGAVTAGSLERLIPSNRRRRCWSPMMQNPDLALLPAARAHCLIMRPYFASEISRGSTHLTNPQTVGYDEKISPNCITKRPCVVKKTPLPPSSDLKRDNLVKHRPPTIDCKAKLDVNKINDISDVHHKNLLKDKLTLNSGIKQVNKDASTANYDTVSLISPSTPAVAKGVQTSCAMTADRYKIGDNNVVNKTLTCKNLCRHCSNQMLHNPSIHHKHFRCLSKINSLPGSPSSRGKCPPAARSCSARHFCEKSFRNSSITRGSKQLPASVPCSPIQARHKYSLSGSPPNSPRGSPPVSPFASHALATSTSATKVQFFDTRCNRKIPHSPQSSPDILCQERVFDRVEPFIKFHEGSTLLHWASSKGHQDIVVELLARGLKVDARDSLGRTPLGVTMWAGHSPIVALLQHEKLQLTDEDKNWSHIPSEEVGLCIVKCITDTGVCELTACRPDGFSLLHLAAQKGYPNMMHRLMSLKVNPDLPNNQGETPLFIAIKNNQLACVQQLLNAGTKLSRVDNRGGSALHVAAKMGNVTVVDMLLTTSESEERNVDVNKCDNIGYTPVYYAINASRYDIVQRFLEYSLVEKVHVKATNHETLLQFFTERNNLGQFDNALVRVLECEQLLHASKVSAEMCLRVQLGTTEASSKARSQLQAMYESTPAQQHCWNFWFFLSCFLVPSVFYYLDVYTDILLAVEYYKDFKNANSSEVSEDVSVIVPLMQILHFLRQG